jgi:hypothetical protein
LNIGGSPAVITGCIESGFPIVGATVKIKQKNNHQQTMTDSSGCYSFSDLAADETGTITIEFPALPISP